MEIGLVAFGGFAALAAVAQLIGDWRGEASINKVTLLAVAVLGVLLFVSGLARLIGD